MFDREVNGRADTVTLWSKCGVRGARQEDGEGKGGQIGVFKNYLTLQTLSCTHKQILCMENVSNSSVSAFEG